MPVVRFIAFTCCGQGNGYGLHLVIFPEMGGDGGGGDLY